MKNLLTHSLTFGAAVLALVTGLLILQTALDITNVLIGLPMSVVLAHNGIAVMVLVSLVTLFHYMSLPKERFGS